MRRTAPWLIALAAVLACVFLAMRDRTDRLEVVRLRSEGTTQTRRLTENHTRLTELERKYAAAATALTEAKAKLAAGEGGSGGGDSEKSKTVMLHMHDLIRDHPEMAEIFRSQVRRNVQQQYGSILGSLSLPPEQNAKLKDLLVEMTMSPIDAAGAATQLGVAQDAPEMQKAQSQARREVEKEITALVGADTAAMFNGGSAYMLQTGVGEMAEAGHALSAEQMRTVAQVAADARNPQKNPAARDQGAYEADPETGLTPIEQGVLQRASGVLSPEQLGILKSTWVQQHQQQAIMKQATGGANSWSIQWN